ncbi:DNA-binding PadR family transcriptional regulator [Paenibacillus cellulosilyticus]|uniref:DNA-binding PadR family transcriptional regulator n=1 Tax=Paenibacillus cellulosilyticus TaxID=375489 RepID=A0A2V2YV54_9BACL|nr:PadR family transcriptional regulator [Paenibacillus cellulosilyticus]PWW05107.1 DNA-binding PadR family transcriptional regulator [Paenibacillus cellulosilyticus]QKS48658.1 PadR family transcriptional regulator [Paenibacillus cellulosilyticus]
MAARKISNMLALAVLSLLHEKPMHPYEMSATMKERGIPDVIKLNNGSLYSVVEALLKQGWIVPLETQREGRHPERTIYAPTEVGRLGFHDWLRELIYEPMKEYPHFPAALAFIGHVPPLEMNDLLDRRIGFIRKAIAERRAGIEFARGLGLSRIFVIEAEYIIHQLESELQWLMAFKEDIRNGSLTEQSDGEINWHMTTPPDGAHPQDIKSQSKGTT